MLANAQCTWRVKHEKKIMLIFEKLEEDNPVIVTPF